MKTDVLTADEISTAFEGTTADDGKRTKPVQLARALLAMFSGCSCGHTYFQILVQLRLITLKGTITRRGKKLMMQVFYR